MRKVKEKRKKKRNKKRIFLLLILSVEIHTKLGHSPLANVCKIRYILNINNTIFSPSHRFVWILKNSEGKFCTTITRYVKECIFALFSSNKNYF